MEIVSSIRSTVIECTLALIKTHISYVLNYEKNVSNLEDQVERLRDTESRVQHDVDAAEGNGEKIEDDVKKWLDDVKSITAVANKVKELEAQEGCFFGLCVNFKSRYQLGKSSEEATKTVTPLLERKFERVSYRLSLRDIRIRPDKYFQVFESRVADFNWVMEGVKDDNLSIIGVYGMGGVGKTTLVKKVARQVEEEKLFDEVVLAEVTQNFEIKKIQDQIADTLGLKLEEQSESGRAARLH